MDQIIKYAFIKSFEPGYVLFRENLIVGQIMYVILSGKVDLAKKNAAGEDVVFLTLGPGALLGEMSLFEQQKRSASAIVREYSELLVMPKYNFDRMIQSRPNEAIKILLNFIKILSQRLRDTTNKMIQAQSEAEESHHASPAPAPQAAPQQAPVPMTGVSVPPPSITPDRLAIKSANDKGSEMYVLTAEELASGNLVQIIEEKRRQGLTTDSNVRMLMIRDLVNYYLQLPLEELQLKVREMELRFRSRPK
ncbi:MAG: cyclic nucleotide-binding domain-containing protein [Chloroherpetonaceae bacterium]|nr:cyclic nucleotide-binding domain-containing protein [Chloroherpetonaceae bacterium]